MNEHTQTSPHPAPLTLDQALALSDEELRVRVAEIARFDQWIIVKNGAYYRPQAGGYTNSILGAWKLPKHEAKRYEMYADRSDIPNCEKVTIQPAPLPDYPNSHDALAPVIAGLSDDEWGVYSNYLYQITGVRREYDDESSWMDRNNIKPVRAMIDATPRQKAVAVIMAKQKPSLPVVPAQGQPITQADMMLRAEPVTGSNP